MRIIARSALALVTAAAVAACVAGIAGAAGPGAPVATVPVAGTTDAGTFVGALAVSGFSVADGQVVALGTVTGSVIDAAGNTVARVDAAPVAAPVQAAQAGCTLLSFSFGPFDVNVLGLVVVHVEPIAANVQLEGLLGSLLCGLIGGGTVPPLPAAV
jgi:hypothetical protein